MAYSSVRVQFEIGHEASVRTKKTPDGFTHDWEVFVKGADNTDIQHFVEKVVFHLHETFPKPRRVIKEPPYIVKESGYAGFVLPIDVYLKNREEPKKISFQYDLTLQNSGPPISRVLREPRVFQNPSEDFRRKLIRGGGVGVDTPNETQLDDHKPSGGSNKSKPTESPSRKHKPELKLNDPFSQVFGTPIKRVTPEPKKGSDVLKLPESDKHKKKPVKSHKEEKVLTKEKDKYADRDRAKERDKNKDKVIKSQPPPQPLVKVKEEHKKLEEKERKREEHEEKKKRKEERDKREKHKDGKNPEKQTEKEVRKDKKEPRNNDYLKKLNALKSYENKSSDKNSNDLLEKEKHKHRHKKKEKEKTRDKERHRKDKEKHDKDSREKNREKEKIIKVKHDDGKEREEKVRRKSRTPSPMCEKVKKGPLDELLNELGSSDSASPFSEDEDSIPSFKSANKTPAKLVPENKPQSVVNMSPKIKSTNFNSSLESRGDKEVERHVKSEESIAGKSKRDKSPGKKGKKSDADAADKRKVKEHKRRSLSIEREKDEDEVEKPRRETDETDPFEREQSERERLDEDKPKSSKKDKDSNRKRKRDKAQEQSGGKSKKDFEADNSFGASHSTDSPVVPTEEAKKPEKFTKEYVAQLRDLQHRIMTLEDNDDLQKVVQVIAETGQYEITKKTFDFDLCALDGETVRRLQEFFSST